VFRLFSGLESVEMHGNVFVRRGGGTVNLLREVEAEWTSGRAIEGTSNWVSTGSTNVPPEWTRTLSGDDPGFVWTDDLERLDPSLHAGSPLIDSALTPPVFTAHPFDAGIAGRALWLTGAPIG
jgi:hypothetical protein